MNRKDKPRCVFVIKRNGKPYRYMTRTVLNNTKIYLGCYKTPEEAHEAYQKFMYELHNYDRKNSQKPLTEI